MSHLLYKTRSNVAPHGKSRVYFAAHPEDTARYLDDIAQIILSTENCVIWYDPAPSREVDMEEHLSSLEEMQLFVLPVTYTFLTSPSRARDVELPWALEHRIPVLPLMQEPGLESLFSKVCGEMQFLDRTSRDETAISFEKKLTDYLRAVLIGEALAEEIRAAFDGYIFLSYRKKDRRQAQELMRLIHANEGCQDVAIWYDEYLTPGESFRENIEVALEKCQLFALAVTPNLVCEPNYVQTVEYPLAKKLGKPILSALLEPTSEALLQEQYVGLPALTDPHDEKALSHELLSVFGERAAREKKADPRHDYLMGMAYLGGVDVEVDYARAVEFLTRAAEGGCVDAAAKLSSMYQTGEGVVRDTAQAVAWQEEAVRLSRTAYRAAPSMRGAIDYLNQYFPLCKQYLYLTRDLDRAETGFLDLIREGEEIHEAYDDGFSQAIVFYAYDKLGVLHHERGNLEEAVKWFEKGLSVRLSNRVDADAPIIQGDLSHNYILLGDVYMENGSYAAALDAMEHALAHAERLCEMSNGVDAQRFLASAYRSLAEVYRALGNRTEAQVHFAHALSISRTISLETRLPMDRMNVSSDLFYIGESAFLGGNYEAAEELQRDALSTCRAVCAETGLPNARRSLIFSLWGLSKTLCHLNRNDEAEPLAREAVDLAEDLFEECPTPDAQSCVSICWRTLAELLLDRGQLAEAEELLRCANAEDEALAKANGDSADLRHAELTSTLSLALCILQGERAEEAEPLFLKALSLSDALWREYQTDFFLCDLLTVLDNLIVFYRDRGLAWQAADYMQRSADLRQEQLGDLPSRKKVMELALRLNELGELYESLDLYEEALTCHERAHTLRADHMDRVGHTYEDLQNLASGYEHLGRVLCCFEGGAEEAQDLLDEALSLRRTFLDLFATQENREQLAFALFYRGEAEEAPFGRPYFEESLSLLRALEKDFPENEDYSAMCREVEERL